MSLERYTYPLLFCLLLCFSLESRAQQASLQGRITAEGKAVEAAKIALQGTAYMALSDSLGNFEIASIAPGSYKMIVTAIAYRKTEKTIQLEAGENRLSDIELEASNASLNEVVVSGTMKEVSKLESPVPVEVYSAQFFKSNPTPSIFDALQNVNGVRPQINCNVCNTGDIHINGLEGPYTMVLIDGMPIVSGLSSVYGLSGIPQALIERVEIVKGPASTLYGSEAVGGLINIITKRPGNAPRISADVFSTSWGELSADVAGKFRAGKKAQSLLGLNYFNFQNRVDHNQDGFTDLTLQNRISVFNKWSFERKNHRAFSLAARYVYEDRWGGDTRWTKAFRGGDSIYGESIYTSRWEVLGNYQLPLKEDIRLQFSANSHDQNSVYGNTPYLARQDIAFAQLNWNKSIGWQELLIGTAFRYTYYDDNTPATSHVDSLGQSHNSPSRTYLPGIFVQDEIRLNAQNKLLLGMRYDYNSIHGNIFTPRLNYKWNSANLQNVLRFSIGNGYRVANVFTEDHAALTGSRELVFLEDLKPESSWNGNINMVKKIFVPNGTYIGLDASAFHTYFSNKIIADYDTDPNKIIYDNLKGYAISQGFSLNMDIVFPFGLKVLMGGTYMDVHSVEDGIKRRQLFTEKFTGVWNISYRIRKTGLSIDYTGNVYSPMRLPLLSATDPRRAYSPWWSIQNIQLTQKWKNGWEIYGGIKNLLNWTPNRGNPFIIARSHDPFDKQVQFDANGQAIACPENPYGLSFDPAYVYGPNQGIRAFLGLRYSLP